MISDPKLPMRLLLTVPKFTEHDFLCLAGVNWRAIPSLIKIAGCDKRLEVHVLDLELT